MPNKNKMCFSICTYIHINVNAQKEQGSGPSLLERGSGTIWQEGFHFLVLFEQFTRMYSALLAYLNAGLFLKELLGNLVKQYQLNQMKIIYLATASSMAGEFSRHLPASSTTKRPFYVPQKKSLRQRFERIRGLYILMKSDLII